MCHYSISKCFHSVLKVLSIKLFNHCSIKVLGSIKLLLIRQITEFLANILQAPDCNFTRAIRLFFSLNFMPTVWSCSKSWLWVTYALQKSFVKQVLFLVTWNLHSSTPLNSHKCMSEWRRKEKMEIKMLCV